MSILNYVIILVVGFLLAFMLTQIILPRILIISLKKRLFDEPDARKIHKRPIPRLGGVSFFPSILFSLTFVLAIAKLLNWNVFGLMPEQASEGLFLCSGMTLLYIVGIADDLVGVRYRQKFVVQFLSACMFPLAGLYINDFYGIFWIHQIPMFVGIPLTVLLVIFITNAINLIDGIDGLASGLSMVALAVYTGLFMHLGLWMYSLLAIASFGVLCPFFYYNVFGNADRGKKIFMGDTGSLTLGFILSFLTVKFTMNPELSRTTEAVYPGAIIIAFSLLLVPCLDVIRVVLHRIRFHQSPFLPDKNHIHHKFLALGFTPRKAMITILNISLVFGIANILLVHHVNNTLLFICDVLIWTVMHVVITNKIKKGNS